MWRKSPIQRFALLNVERIGHGVALHLVRIGEHVPPVEILNLLGIICSHVNLIMQTVEVLANDEYCAEENEHLARSTIYSFISCVYGKESHVSQIVYAVQIQDTLNEE